MKNKDNINVFESFQQFIKDSKKYKPTIIMSDHDSTFTSNQFKEFLESIYKRRSSRGRVD
jgi:hypothetical protein